MAFRPHPARAPSVLLREAKPLKAIFGHAKRLAHLQRLLESQLQPAAREHCHVASWREGSLLLIVTDGHWSTRLRYQQKRLQRQLQALQQNFLHAGGWYECRDAAGDVSRQDMPSTTPYHLATCYSGLAQFL